MKKRNIFLLSLLAGLSLPAAAQQDSTGISFVDQVIEVGANKDFTRAQSTAAVSVITNRDVNKRSAKNIGNSILGQGNGLVSLQGTGTYFEQNPTFYIRGLQSLSTSTPLVLVDGVERDLSIVSPEEVDHVSILKDAAAVALYGYKGANGAILITTKRGQYNSKNIRVSYDHLFNFQTNRPKFVNGATFASAMNEALDNEGSQARYTADEIAAFQSGNYPFQYPNVNWVDETFRKSGATNKINVEFSGGGERFRYFTMLNLLSDKGFIKNFDATDGYSTQDKYVRGNLRTNLDIDLTPTTMLKVNMLGVLSEMSRPGGPTSIGSSSSTAKADLWDMAYSIPSLAFPVKNEDGDWGGSSVYSGVNNPVAESSGAAYYKLHERALFADMTLTQDLKYWTPGLSLTARLGYDTYSTLYEDHSMTYLYGNYPSTGVVGQKGDLWTSGTPGTMSKNSGTVDWARRLIFSVGMNYDRTFADKHYVYTQLKWDYEYQNTTGSTGYTVYRHNISWLGHYGFDNRYIGEVALVYSGSNRLAPGTKWNLSPTFSAAWVASNESFMKDVKWINFLKLRASYGIINADYLPGDNVWNYYAMSYAQGSSNTGSYPFGAGYDYVYANSTLGLLPTANPKHEKANKFNIGIDATLFGGLNVELDYYMQQRKNIWVAGTGAYTALIGFDAPYINAGKVNSSGFELSLDYTKTLGEVTFNVGGMLNLNKNEIKDMAEEPKAYANLVETGNPLNSTYGLVALGLFTTSDDLNGDGIISTDECKSLGIPTQNFSTVRPGDIKYQDINGDGVIDANDKTKIGYSAYAPELFYNFHAGAEYKGVGIDLMFQGVGRYTANLSAKGMYWPLLNSTSLSQQYYDGRWTASNPDPGAKFPRLSTESNANNYQTSTYWQRDRSFLKLRNVEVYYKFPSSLLEKTKYIQTAKLYVRGVDLLCFNHLDDADPECYGVTAPLNKSVVLGVQLSF